MLSLPIGNICRSRTISLPIGNGKEVQAVLLPFGNDMECETFRLQGEHEHCLPLLFPVVQVVAQRLHAAI